MPLSFDEAKSLGSSNTVYVVDAKGKQEDAKPENLQFLHYIDAEGNKFGGEGDDATLDSDVEGGRRRKRRGGAGKAVIVVFSNSNDPTPVYYVEGPDATDAARDAASPAKPVDIYYEKPSGGRRHRKSRITRKKRKATRRTRKH